MNGAHLRALALWLGLALPCLGGTDLGGSWRLDGRNSRGSYVGTATVEQDPDGNVVARLALVYRKWSWLRFRYVETGRVESVRLEGRIEGDHLVGRRFVAMAGRIDPWAGAVRYRILRGPSLFDSSLAAVQGSYTEGDEQAFERLSGHVPSGPSAGRTEALAALRADLERAILSGRWKVVVLEGAGDYVRDAEDLKRELRLPALRAAETVPHEQLLDPEQDMALSMILGVHLDGLQGYRIGDRATLLGGEGGSFERFVLGRNHWGDLIGVRSGP